VSMFVFLNSDWDKDGGGVVRLWPPMRPTGPPSTAATSTARRSPTSSDAGTTFSEISDCGSLRWVGRLLCCSQHRLVDPCLGPVLEGVGPLPKPACHIDSHLAHCWSILVLLVIVSD
jgi:hypothetical protein